jgi:hypothetical protein
MASQIAWPDTYGLFLWSCIIDEVNVHSLLNNFQELKDRICQALKSIDTDTLHKARDECTYHLDVVRFTSGAHIEHL